MDVAEQDNSTKISIAPEATTKHRTSCKGITAATEFLSGLATCNKCRTKKRLRRNKKAVPEDEDRTGKKLCSSKKLCPIKSFADNNKTSDHCIKAARSLTVARRQRQYAVPAYSATNTSKPDFLQLLLEIQPLKPHHQTHHK